ncbi:hypothetical protein GOV11_03885 [Candidatus Woesearchaeota archaeon]|nr:hypothetical protein [Candidatus Woesearchaeota archaeon]
MPPEDTALFRRFRPETDVRGVSISLDNQIEGMFGVQIGGRNVSFYTKGIQFGANNIAQVLDGVQLGLKNYSEASYGIQVGLICEASEGSYLQLGLLTLRNKDQAWYKNISPLIGFSRNKRNNR